MWSPPPPGDHTFFQNNVLLTALWSCTSTALPNIMCPYCTKEPCVTKSWQIFPDCHLIIAASTAGSTCKRVQRLNVCAGVIIPVYLWDQVLMCLIGTLWPTHRQWLHNVFISCSFWPVCLLLFWSGLYKHNANYKGLPASQEKKKNKDRKHIKWRERESIKKKHINKQGLIMF